MSRSNMSSTVRPIQPNPHNEPKPRNRSARVESGASKKRRIGVRIACDACRHKKSSVSSKDPAIQPSNDMSGPKCDGVKPTCGRCHGLRLECVFQKPKSEENELLKSELHDLRDTLKEYHDFLDQIKTLPDQHALELLRQVGSARNDGAMLSLLKGTLHGRYVFLRHNSLKSHFMAPFFAPVYFIYYSNASILRSIRWKFEKPALTI